jgi:cell division protein FtsI (penicillin-binding protein 3)
MNIVSQLRSAWRLYAIIALMALMAAVLLGRMVMLQLLDDAEHGHQFLQGQGEARSVRTEVIPAHRGMIVDRNGEPLAVSTPVVTVFCDPRKLQDQKKRWPQLAAALKIPAAELSQKLKQYQKKEFMYLKRHMVPGDADEILALGINGVYGKREYRRYYPAGEVAAQLIGFTNIDERGQEGLELAYDQWLEGKPGSKRVMKNLYGHVINDIKLLSDAEPGKDLQLSIDLRLQYLAYRELKAAVHHHKADGGTIVVLDAKSGEVLAMASQPSFNPNNRTGMDVSAARNRAVTDTFEPGSTVKPFTVIAALESGKYTPHTIVDTTPGFLRVGNKTLMDPVNYGPIDVTKVITKSSQIGTSKIALSLDEHKVYDVFQRLGLGQTTGTGFPGENMGLLPNHRIWRPIERVTFAFGHGLTVTALQLAQAYTVFANQGQRRGVSLLKTDKPVPATPAISPEIASQVLAMMSTVTQKGGTAVRAQVRSYFTAGKTGTAHKVGAGGYEDSEYVAFFAGLAPATNPELVSVVLIDAPHGNQYYGGEVAAPVFSGVMSGALRLLNVAPDDWHAPDAVAAKKLAGTAP